MSQRRRAQSKKGHQNGKQRIVDEAKRNTFDRNPLLNTAHQAVCKNCGKDYDVSHPEGCNVKKSCSKWTLRRDSR